MTNIRVEAIRISASGYLSRLGKSGEQLRSVSRNETSSNQVKEFLKVIQVLSQQSFSSFLLISINFPELDDIL